MRNTFTAKCYDCYDVNDQMVADCESVVDARLIAAAPDLLAACKAVQQHLLTTFPPYADGVPIPPTPEIDRE